MILKVCGMRNPENIRGLLTIKPDFIGFIFHKASKRNVVEKLTVSIPSNIKKVGVFVDESFEFIKDKIDSYKLDYIQLHGNETPDFCCKLKESNCKIIKAFNISNSFDFNSIKNYESYCDLLLFDAFGKKAGGNGIVFNWNLIQKYKGNTPFLLSGGINSTMLEAIRNFKHDQFKGIDINSGFETSPALKDIALIQRFKETLNIK